MAEQARNTRVRSCASCDKPLPPAAPYYRFALATQAEQDVIWDGRPESADPHAVLRELEAVGVDADFAEQQVHCELSGALCPSCWARLLGFLGQRTALPH